MAGTPRYSPGLVGGADPLAGGRLHPAMRGQPVSNAGKGASMCSSAIPAVPSARD